LFNDFTRMLELFRNLASDGGVRQRVHGRAVGVQCFSLIAVGQFIEKIHTPMCPPRSGGYPLKRRLPECLHPSCAASLPFSPVSLA
jgi:hypothetical protein